MIPDPPAWMHEYAKEEWRRHAPALHLAGRLDSLNLSAFENYCCAYARWKRAEEELAGHPLVQVTEKGYEAPSAIATVAKAAAVDMRKSLAEFGLSPLALKRLKATVEAAKRESKLKQFMGTAES